MAFQPYCHSQTDRPSCADHSPFEVLTPVSLRELDLGNQNSGIERVDIYASALLVSEGNRPHLTSMDRVGSPGGQAQSAVKKVAS